MVPKQCPFRRPTIWYLVYCATCFGSRDNSKYHTYPPTHPPTNMTQVGFPSIVWLRLRAFGAQPPSEQYIFTAMLLINFLHTYIFFIMAKTPSTTSNNEWRLPNVLFNWLSSIGHPVTQKGVVWVCQNGTASHVPLFVLVDLLQLVGPLQHVSHLLQRQPLRLRLQLLNVHLRSRCSADRRTHIRCHGVYPAAYGPVPAPSTGLGWGRFSSTGRSSASTEIGWPSTNLRWWRKISTARRAG